LNILREKVNVNKLLTKPPVTWAEAAEECCLRNMSMAAFDDDDVIETFRMINFNTGEN